MITTSEAIDAIIHQKNRKETGPDKIHTDMNKPIANKKDTELELLQSLFDRVYKSSNSPSDGLRSTFIALPKISTSFQCNDDCLKYYTLEYTESVTSKSEKLSFFLSKLAHEEYFFRQ